MNRTLSFASFFWQLRDGHRLARPNRTPLQRETATRKDPCLTSSDIRRLESLETSEKDKRSRCSGYNGTPLN